MDRMEERLKEIRQREQKATPGPWVSIEETWNEGAVGGCPKMVTPWREDAFEGDDEAAANMDFIYHARQDIPFLLDRIEQLETQVEDLRDDFVDYACSGIPNLAPYCKNKTDDCTDGRNWCNSKPGACKGFCPSAWRRGERV